MFQSQVSGKYCLIVEIGSFSISLVSLIESKVADFPKGAMYSIEFDLIIISIGPLFRTKLDRGIAAQFNVNIFFK